MGLINGESHLMASLDSCDQEIYRHDNYSLEINAPAPIEPYKKRADLKDPFTKRPS